MGFTGPDAGLFADHPFALHLAHLAVGVGDDPAARAQGRRELTLVADGDRVDEHVTRDGRIGLIGQIGGLDFDGYGAAASGLFHGHILRKPGAVCAAISVTSPIPGGFRLR